MSSNWIKRSTRKAIYQRDNHTCVYCEQTVLIAAGMSREEQIRFMRENADKIATLDHVISQWTLAQTAEYSIKDPRNLVTTCNACNSSKKNTPLDVWCNQRGFNVQAIQERIAQRLAA